MWLLRTVLGAFDYFRGVFDQSWMTLANPGAKVRICRRSWPSLARSRPMRVRMFVSTNLGRRWPMPQLPSQFGRVQVECCRRATTQTFPSPTSCFRVSFEYRHGTLFGDIPRRRNANSDQVESLPDASAAKVGPPPDQSTRTQTAPERNSPARPPVDQQRSGASIAPPPRVAHFGAARPKIWSTSSR